MRQSPPVMHFYSGRPMQFCSGVDSMQSKSLLQAILCNRQTFHVGPWRRINAGGEFTVPLRLASRRSSQITETLADCAHFSHIAWIDGMSAAGGS
jgi:hypothetical protein